MNFGTNVHDHVCELFNQCPDSCDAHLVTEISTRTLHTIHEESTFSTQEALRVPSDWMLTRPKSSINF